MCQEIRLLEEGNRGRYSNMPPLLSHGPVNTDGAFSDEVLYGMNFPILPLSGGADVRNDEFTRKYCKMIIVHHAGVRHGQVVILAVGVINIRLRVLVACSYTHSLLRYGVSSIKYKIISRFESKQSIEHYISKFS